MPGRPPPPPGFTLDEDDEDQLPPPPPGFQLDARASAPKRSEPPQPAPSLDGTITRPLDGDTLALSTGAHVRLPTVDAPELKQQGWDRQGRPVPIGRQSLDAMSAAIAAGQARLGQPIGQSYGRSVAPVTIDDQDLGLNLTRDGNVLVDRRFLPKDPQQRYDLLQTERLARQNFRGVHNTFHQTPGEFRADPNYVPDREEVAQFWDTPTPLAGMTAAAEQQYLALLNDFAADPQKVIDFARSQGFTVDPAGIAQVRSYARANKIPISKEQIAYRGAPKPLTDPGDGTTGAGTRGLANGVLFNQLEELGAAVDTLGLTSGRENVWSSDRRLADIYANNLGQNEAITGFDRSEHPYAYGAGELGGAFVVPMARVHSAADLAKWGAAYGGLSGLGEEGTIPERLTSGVVGSGVGLATTVLGTKALEAASPYVAKGVRRVLGRGAEGVEAADPLRIPDTIDIGPGAPPEPPLHDPVHTAYPGPVAVSDAPAPTMRDRSWIDIGEVPPPPAGYRLDTQGSLAMKAEPMDSVSAPMRRPDYLDLGGVRPSRLDDPLTQEQMARVANDITPADMLPIHANEVGSVEEAARVGAGRYGEATAPNERGELDRRTVRAWNGAEVPKVGPVDLIGFLRSRGGLRDEGGELSHMGFDNRARRLDFAGTEQRFGPLVNAEGMSLEDAAQRAFDEGYFPDLPEAPTRNEMINALRETYEGHSNRRFLPEDQPEIDRYYGARADRQALDQQRFETGQPVYVDRSTPAGPDQPFPPPEAYEEWPAGGPDFAGNINLNKLDTPQDIKRALVQSHNRVGGFDAATRGRVSWAETERLAGELGMTPETLLARRRGQPFNAEEALAARQILAKSGNELVNLARRVQSIDNPGDEVLAEFRHAWTRHAAIQEQVSGMTAEAGRALQQFRQVANSRNMRGDVLSAIVRSGGGPDRLRDAADIILEAVEQGPGKFNAVVEKAAKPRFRDKLIEVYINSLLSGPQTHVVNMVSNSLTALAQIPEHAAASAIGRARQVLPRASADRVLASEVGARAFGLLQGAKEGAAYFVRALKSGEPVDLVSKVESQDMKATSGLKGEIVRVPTRLLTAEDEFFKGVARRMELNGLAVRKARAEGLRGDAAKARIADLVANPPDEMLARSMDYARYVTFQQKLGPAASKISGFTQDMPALKLFLPFVRTPTNLLKFAAERSPAAPLLREWRADFQAGGARRDLALAKAMVGTGLGVAMYEAALNGQITGSAPGDPKKAKLLYADGWQPYSIRVGDKWYSYKRLDPFSTTIGTAADLALLPEGMSTRQREDMVTLFVASIMGNLASKTWLSGVSDVVGALAEPEMNADRLVQRLAGSLAVPAGVAQIARTLDPVSRETDSIGDAIKARVPGLSTSLAPRRDVWGRPVESEGGVGPDFVSPIWQSTAQNDPVNRELLGIDYAPGDVKREVGGRKLTPKEYDRYKELAGQFRYQNIRQLITSPGWMNMDLEAREAAAEKAAKAGAAAARSNLFGADVAASQKRSGAQSAPPPPPGFTADGDAGGMNVYADLQKAIPGIRFTSGFRTPEYQAEMRRRGYNPAFNSGHLDGSSLDMLPPPGKSRGWLKGQVARRYPNAPLLVHDGHLHATFPGYYGAPVLGGAKSAGLRNPNIGMPAPPAGFKLD